MPDREHTYASGIAGESVNRSYATFEVEGQQILSCNSFLSFAQQFFSMIEVAERWGMVESVKVYGESLVNAMALGDSRTEWHYQKGVPHPTGENALVGAHDAHQ